MWSVLALEHPRLLAHVTIDCLQHSLEQAEKLIKAHEGFITTMQANDEKINNVLQFASRLVEDGHYAEDKIEEKADSLSDRYSSYYSQAVCAS